DGDDDRAEEEVIAVEGGDADRSPPPFTGEGKGWGSARKARFAFTDLAPLRSPHPRPSPASGGGGKGATLRRNPRAGIMAGPVRPGCCTRHLRTSPASFGISGLPTGQAGWKVRPHRGCRPGQY